MAITLYDYNGNPVDLSKLREEESGPVITGVRPVLSGHPAVGLTPSRLAWILRDAEEGDPTLYMELAEDMEERDMHYRSVLATRKTQVSGLEISVEPASDSAQDSKIADFLRTWLKREQLQFELFDVLDAVGKGYSATEIIWESSEGQWMPSRLEWRDPRWFWLNIVDRKTLMLRTEQGPTPLSPYKYIIHHHKSKSGLPIRGGLARVAAWGYLFKNLDIKGWVQLAEIFGIPLRVGKYGAGATENDKKALLQAVANICQDTAAIIPASMQVEFVEAHLTGNITLFEDLAEFLDKQVSKAVLGQTGTTDVGQHVGTANAHEQVRQDIETMDATQLSATFNRDIGRPLVDLNFGPQRAYPRIKIGREPSEDLTATAQILSTVVPLGMKVSQKAMRDRFGFPEPENDQDVLTMGQAPPAESEPGHLPAETLTTQSAQAATSPEFVPDAIDTAVVEELGDWQSLVNPLLAPVQRLLNECSTFDEFMQRLPEVIPAQDAAKLTDHLAQMMFSARLAGEAGQDIGHGKP